MSVYSEEFLAGWAAARTQYQTTGGVQPHPPEPKTPEPPAPPRGKGAVGDPAGIDAEGDE